MYSRGHVGLALLAYAPIAGVILDAGAVELALVGGVLAVAFATIPDVDQMLPIPHRGPTHTLAFALATGIAAALVATVVMAGSAPSAPSWTPLFVGTVVTITLCSHIAGDAITPMGIQPFRPLSEFHYTMDLTPAKNPRANHLFLAVGVVALAAVVAVVP
ncbi:metal-dependent hydrolase [Halorubrum sp. DTA98]|uniref:metal-dependent hydrolase n=1 Tax=Halorubrum sp. DTA98 TaxID=3402163 RepID=UPI003AAFCB9A